MAAKARVALMTMRYPEAWMLPPRVARMMLKSLFRSRPTRAGTGTILHVNSPPVESRAFRRYLTGLRKMAGGEGVPLVVHVAVTDRCEYRCERCSNQFMRTGAPDPSFENLAGLLRSLKDAGTVTVAFTGGEPALRHDLCELVAACAPEMASLFFTSGQHIDSAVAAKLRSAGLAMVVVSLDSDRECEHDAIRGSSGAFRRAISAIAYFRENGVYTAVHAVVGSGALSDRARVDAFVEYCGKLGVHEVILLDPMAIGKCGGSNGEAREYARTLHHRTVEDKETPKVTAAAYLESADWVGCLAGHSFFYVSSAGDLFPCDFVPMSFGNVFESGFGPVFERARSVIRMPCTKCLTTQVAAVAGTDARYPLRWEQTKELLPRFESTEPSAMMRWMGD